MFDFYYVSLYISFWLQCSFASTRTKENTSSQCGMHLTLSEIRDPITYTKTKIESVHRFNGCPQLVQHICHKSQTHGHPKLHIMESSIYRWYHVLIKEPQYVGKWTTSYTTEVESWGMFDPNNQRECSSLKVDKHLWVWLSMYYTMCGHCVNVTSHCWGLRDAYL